MENKPSCVLAQAISGTGTEREVLNSARPWVKKFCMYSERNSGSNWVASLLQVRSYFMPSCCPFQCY